MAYHRVSVGIASLDTAHTEIIPPPSLVSIVHCESLQAEMQIYDGEASL